MNLQVALSIAGSDSGGGAGIQADLRVMARMGVFGTTAITAVTAQNLEGVHAVEGLDPDVVVAQIAAVFDGFSVSAAKTGMLWSADIVRAVAASPATSVPLVVDPVMVATSGARLMDEGAVNAYRRELLPRAAVVTPNLDEAAVLLEVPSIDDDAIADSAIRLADRLGTAVLLKGGHMAGTPVDVLVHERGRAAWMHDRVRGVNTHGTGCMLSAAIAARLAGGKSLVVAVEGALAFVHDALARGAKAKRQPRLAAIEAAEARLSHLSRVT